jgi:hypothetical protein
LTLDRLDIDPYYNDPGRWAHSLRNLAEVMLPCLDAAGARSVMEVGAYAGDLTEVLCDWARLTGATVAAIDPMPQPRLVELAEQREELELIRETSLAALPKATLADAVVIDGDHNHYTVSEELRLVEQAAGDNRLPLLLFHDVCWPHGRRDDYYDPDQIPAEHRQPIHEGGGLFPEEPGIRPGGLPYRHAAAREGGPGNGVLTAVEDFVATRDHLRLAIVPAVLEPWDGNPLVARLEANRVHHLAAAHVNLTDAARAQQRAARMEVVLRRLLESSAFSVAEQLSALRVRAGVAPEHSVVSKAEIRRALEPDA